MKHRTLDCRVWVMVAGLCTLIVPAISNADLTAESYCQTAGQIGPKELVYLGKLEVLAGKYTGSYAEFQRYCSDPKVYLDQRAAAQKEFNDAKAAILAAYGTTAEEYAAFQTANKEALAAYLEANPETKAALDALAQQIEALKAKLRVPTYCLLTIAHAKQKAQEISEQIAVANQYADTPATFLEQEQLKRKEWDAKINALFKLFDTSAKDYLAFPSKNKQPTEQYLEQRPIIEQAIYDLSRQVIGLLQQYEDLRKNIVVEVPPKPELP